MHYLLIYDVVDDYVTRRVPLRAAHIGHARQSIARGDLVLGGALANPPDGAVLLFRGSSPAAAEQFAQNDPYVVNEGAQPVPVTAGKSEEEDDE